MQKTRPVIGTRAKPHRRTAAPARPGVSISPVGWSAERDLAFAQWVEHGRKLGVAGRGAGWWLGDWVRYGATKYGGKYARAARVTGYDHKTLMNMVYVASRFEISRRREVLSWSHHAELASFDEADQEKWLDRAVEEKLTVRRLRQELAQGPRAPSAEEAAEARARAAAEHAAVCPNCGFRIDETTGRQA